MVDERRPTRAKDAGEKTGSPEKPGGARLHAGKVGG